MNVPRLAIGALGALMVAAVAGVGGARYAGVPALDVPEAAPVAQRSLHFEDRTDGGIDVVDARSGALLDTVAPGTNGFLRSAVRGLARERKRQALGPDLPFLLVAHADGRLTLEDPGTARHIDLESFGPVNAGAFAKLLRPPTALAPQRQAEQAAQEPQS